MTCTVSVEKFGYGKLIRLHTPAIQCAFATFGAAFISCKVLSPKENRWIEINCSYTSPEEVEADTDYMGVTVGPCAGRIGNGKFTLDGVEYHVARNFDNLHNLHAGISAIDKRHWSFTTVETDKEIGVRFSLVSPHMDLGFPAELEIFAYYYIEIGKPNILHTEYTATIPERSPADATVVNIFSHPLWNLNGLPEENTPSNPRWTQPEKIYNHVVKAPCSRVVDTDKYAIPTGKLNNVEGTILDFRKGKPAGENIDKADFLNREPCGYDHPLCVDGWDEKHRDKVLHNVEVFSPVTKIQMKVSSTYPAVWVYTANKKPAKASGEKGQRYERFTSLFIDPQHYPDCPNRPDFPSCVLRKGQKYFDKAVKEFNVLDKAPV